MAALLRCYLFSTWPRPGGAVADEGGRAGRPSCPGACCLSHPRPPQAAFCEWPHFSPQQLCHCPHSKGVTQKADLLALLRPVSSGAGVHTLSLWPLSPCCPSPQGTGLLCGLWKPSSSRSDLNSPVQGLGRGLDSLTPVPVCKAPAHARRPARGRPWVAPGLGWKLWTVFPREARGLTVQKPPPGVWSLPPRPRDGTRFCPRTRQGLRWT